MKKLLKHLFNSWNEVLLTQNVDQFMRIKAMLSDNGIATKTKIDDFNNNLGRGRISPRDGRAMYYLFVKTEELGRAKALIAKTK